MHTVISQPLRKVAESQTTWHMAGVCAPTLCAEQEITHVHGTGV